MSDSTIKYYCSLLDENLYKKYYSEEVELTKLLAKNYAAIGDYTEGYNSLASLSTNKIKVLNVNAQAV